MEYNIFKEEFKKNCANSSWPIENFNSQKDLILQLELLSSDEIDSFFKNLISDLYVDNVFFLSFKKIVIDLFNKINSTYLRSIVNIFYLIQPSIIKKDLESIFIEKNNNYKIVSVLLAGAIKNHPSIIFDFVCFNQSKLSKIVLKLCARFLSSRLFI